MNRNELVEKYLDGIVREGYSSSKENARFYLNYLFQDVSFSGRSMLDVGGGPGWLSLYATCMGAKPVICIELELEGSRRGAPSKFKQLSETLSLDNVNFQSVTFQDFDPGPGNQTFDIILLHNSINHLDEEACINLRRSDNARNRYKSLFQKLSELAGPGTKLIICDCSRYNFFALLRLKNPFAPSIEWHKHQSPKYWSKMLHDFGFVNPQIRWISPSRLRAIGRFLFDNRFASYFLTSHFCLVTDKK
ncbi:hypothetical protein ES705_42107 [subsurface metagenome]